MAKVTASCKAKRLIKDGILEGRPKIDLDMHFWESLVKTLFRLATVVIGTTN